MQLSNFSAKLSEALVYFCVHFLTDVDRSRWALLQCWLLTGTCWKRNKRFPVAPHVISVLPVSVFGQGATCTPSNSSSELTDFSCQKENEYCTTIKGTNYKTQWKSSQINCICRVYTGFVQSCAMWAFLSWKCKTSHLICECKIQVNLTWRLPLFEFWNTSL